MRVRLLRGTRPVLPATAEGHTTARISCDLVREAAAALGAGEECASLHHATHMSREWSAEIKRRRDALADAGGGAVDKLVASAQEKRRCGLQIPLFLVTTLRLAQQHLTE